MHLSKSKRKLQNPSKTKYEPQKHGGINLKIIEKFESNLPKAVPGDFNFDRKAYEKAGKAVLYTIGDFFEIFSTSRVFGSNYLNHDNFKASISFDLSLRFPYRFYPEIQSIYSSGKKGLLIRRNCTVRQPLHGKERLHTGGPFRKLQKIHGFSKEQQAPLLKHPRNFKKTIGFYILF